MSIVIGVPNSPVSRRHFPSCRTESHHRRRQRYLLTIHIQQMSAELTGHEIIPSTSLMRGLLLSSNRDTLRRRYTLTSFRTRVLRSCLILPLDPFEIFLCNTSEAALADVPSDPSIDLNPAKGSLRFGDYI